MKKLLTVLFLLPVFAFAQTVKISALPSATTISGTEHIPIVQSGTTKKVRVDTLFSNAQLFKTVKVTLDSTAVRGLGTATEILAAPGSGKMYDVKSIHFSLRDGTSSYTTNTAIQVFVGTPSNIPACNTVTSFLANTEKFARAPMPALTAYSYTKADFENKNLTLYTGGGNPAVGNGTLDIYITYQIINL